MIDKILKIYVAVQFKSFRMCPMRLCMEMLMKCQKIILFVYCLICFFGIFCLNEVTNQLIFFDAHIITKMIIWTLSLF
jgi:hypothetical protein